jgi:hypothetical protein
MSGEEFNPHSVDAVLSRLETKLDAALNKMEEIEKRVGGLERFKYFLAGIAGAAGAAGSKVIGLFKV